MSDLSDKKIKYNDIGYTLFVFDVVKLVMYTIYFGKQNINDLLFFKNNINRVGGPEIVALLWNMTVMYCNCFNFIYFMILSREYDVNTILRENKYVDSQKMSGLYQTA